MSRALQQFNSLLNNKTFVLLFIRTLEREREFNVRDKVNVASLLSATLQNRMEYHTEYVLQPAQLMLLICDTAVTSQTRGLPPLEGRQTWDVMAVCTVADSYVAAMARETKRVAELKISKYSGLEDKYVFQPIAVESLGPLNETACQFLKDLGRRISAQSGDERESAFLFQRLSVVIQRFNAILLHNSFEAADHLG